MFYSVVLLDGNELHCLTIEEVQDLFFNRQLNQNSLVCSAEDGKWQMLRRAFNLAEWIPTSAPQSAAPQNPFQPQNNPFEQTVQTPPPNNFQSPQNPFEQTAAANQPVTFNQFPPAQPSQPANPYASNTSNGYSQNNQTETYYQAETNQSNYNFQNNQANFAPSKYSNPANSYNYSPNSGSPYANGKRRGLKPAGAFLLINLFFYVVYALVGSFMKNASDPEGAMKFGETMGKLLIPIFIDLIFISKLIKAEDEESARKWGLFRTYWSFIVFGIIVPVAGFGMSSIAISAFSFVSALFLCLSLLFLLHGKENPPQSRLMLGFGSFAIYFLIMSGTIFLAAAGSLMPNIAKINAQNSKLEQYRVDGKEFQDKTTGAKVLLPEGWSMLKLDNPLIHSPEARMIAVDQAGNRLTMLEVVPVPGNLDLKSQNATFILDQLSDGVVKAMKEQPPQGGSFGGKNSVNEVTRMNIYVGTHQAKLIVLDKTEGGDKLKGHLIITYDELTFYVLHSWCPSNEYDKAQAEFTFFEKNFTVPEKINSTYTQSAENSKK